MAPKRRPLDLADRTVRKRFKSSTSSKINTSEPQPKRPILLESSKDPTGQHPQNKPFNLITALCKHTDILIYLVQYIPPKSIVDLHSISAPFHYQFCSHQTAFILSGTRIYAPSAEFSSPWTQYARLCTYDPGHRLPTYRTPSADAPLKDTLRRIPSLRWLRQSSYRHLVTQSIIAHLTLSGAPFPPATGHALRKLWLCLDLPVSALRISLFRSPFFTNKDLYLLQLFFLKLDMHFTDPISFTGGEVTVRRTLLAEPSLTPLWDALRLPWTRLDALRAWVRHVYVPPRRGPLPEPQAVQRAWDALGPEKVMGVPLSMCGRAGWELYGLGKQKLVRVETLVIGEGVRRGLGLERYLIKMMRYGYLTDRLQAVKITWDEEALLPEKRWARELRRLKAKEREREVDALLRDQDAEWNESEMIQEDVD